MMDSIQVCTIGLVNVSGVNFSPFIEIMVLQKRLQFTYSKRDFLYRKNHLSDIISLKVSFSISVHKTAKRKI